MTKATVPGASFPILILHFAAQLFPPPHAPHGHPVHPLPPRWQSRPRHRLGPWHRRRHGRPPRPLRRQGGRQLRPLAGIGAESRGGDPEPGVRRGRLPSRRPAGAADGHADGRCSAAFRRARHRVQQLRGCEFWAHGRCDRGRRSPGPRRRGRSRSGSSGKN